MKPAKTKIGALREKADWAMIGLGLRGLAFAMMRASKKEPMLARAISELEGVYRFENADGRHHRFLAFGHGKVKMKRNLRGDADFSLSRCSNRPRSTAKPNPNIYSKSRFLTKSAKKATCFTCSSSDL